ncbi:hypothetical protein PMG11_02191 [Penicillium brasilianum]|uniref:Uncharacterized protein n=1 Tax=Penicillium brasilianum TaxID=104259 RepID=A0A0F7TGR9_PENBI|nr:hypothetical protein PMG11_02191 [Penicillium brasilianum]
MPRDLLVSYRKRLKLLLTNLVHHVNNFEQKRPRSYLEQDPMALPGDHPSLLVVLPTLPSRLLAPLGDLSNFLLVYSHLKLLFIPNLIALPLPVPPRLIFTYLPSPHLCLRALYFRRQLLGSHLESLVPRQLGTLNITRCLHL